jgi:hypothetical protein
MRVDLLLSNQSCYTYEAYAARHVSRCLKNLHLAHQLIYLSDGLLQDYLISLQEAPPAWTLSFVNLTPHKKPLCDVMRIPHFLWLEESVGSAFHYLNSTFGKIGVHDSELCKKLSASNVLLLPHGVDTQICEEKKVFEVVVFADLLDLAFLEKTWNELFEPHAITSIKKAIALKDPFQIPAYFFYVEQYLKAQKTVQRVATFHKIALTIFGEHAGNKWLQILPHNIHLHTQLPYIEHFEVLKRSKIALMDPSSHWYLPAIQAGCLPLPAHEETIHFYLTHPKEREKSLQKLRAKALDHTWEKQVNQLINLMHT